jgi:hypothetical protein
MKRFIFRLKRSRVEIETFALQELAKRGAKDSGCCASFDPEISQERRTGARLWKPAASPFRPSA